MSKRHIAKSLSWRLIGTVDTFIFTWFITEDFNDGLNLSVITTVSKLIWYYIHERYWFNSSYFNSNKRHIIKTFSWRGISTIDTVLFGWILFGSPLTGLKIGAVETISKMILYYFHEKLWYKINFGLDISKRSHHLKKKQRKI